MEKGRARNNMKHVLEMRYPSSWWHDLWREGLAAGNGKIGANLYGGAKKETILLTRHDLWYDGEADRLPDVHEAFYRLRAKMDEGNFREASWEIVNALREKGYQARLESPLPLANLTVEQTPVKGFLGFKRTLDMEQALVSHQWQDANIGMRREMFVSRKDDIVVYRLLAEGAEKCRELLEYKLELSAARNEGEQPTEAIQKVWENARTEVCCKGEDTAYLYFGSERDMPDGIPAEFGAVAKVLFPKGKAERIGNRIRVTGAPQILIIIGTYVNEGRKAAWERLHDRLETIDKSFEELLTESAEIHKRLYHSAYLSLGNEEKPVTWKTSNEELLMEAFSGKQSPELIEKLWNYGRYLFICGTSPEANPFPLYGLWGGGYCLQWCHNMANENLQMIYWHSMCGNLIEYNQAIFKYMNERIPAFQENARKLFGLNGIYMTAGTTPDVSVPTQVVPVIINWVSASGWIAQHYYRYFLYTGDMEYARNVMLPYMDEVAKFYEGFVRFTQEGDKERIRFYPSVSPENTPVNFMPPEGVQMAHPMPTTINSTMDLSVLKEFFNNLLEVSKILKDTPFTQERIDQWNRILKAIPEFEINEDGAVKEWQEDIFKDRYDHRHLSHIYPVFPGYELYPEKDPEKIRPYEKAVELRKVDAQTGWSMAHMASIYARFRNGGAAMECLDNMAKSSLLNNFFTLHNDWRGMNISLTMDPAPVQLDAVMGYVNALQEMILYASPGYVALLPALEERLYTGEVKNFRYDNGLICMKWDKEKGYFACRMTPVRSHKVRISLPDFVEEIIWEPVKAADITKITERLWEVEFLKEGSDEIRFSTKNSL